VTLLSSKEPYRHTDMHTCRHADKQTHRAYKWLQVPPFNLTVNVGKDNSVNTRYWDYLMLLFSKGFIGRIFVGKSQSYKSALLVPIIVCRHNVFFWKSL